MQRFLKNNGLSIAFWALFVICLFGQALAGFLLQYENLAAEGVPVSLLHYFANAEFLDGIFSNWQAALLQLLALIVFAIFLRQRGAAHSRKMEGEERKPKLHPARIRSWIYRNSLSLAFLGLFLLAFAAHFTAGLSNYNKERASLGEPTFSAADYLVSAKFWFLTLQAWQAEFFAIGLYLILSVYLRQENSAESKPVEASDEETGETNE